MLNKELVSFETAKLAKELGFDYNCIYTWCEKGGYNKYTKTTIPIFYALRTNGNPFGSYFGGKNWNASKTSTKAKIQCSAPTQSELQRWLREKYDYHIVIIPNVEYFSKIYKSGLGNNAALIYTSTWDDEHSETYEKSLEFCLLKTLQHLTNENSNRSKTKD